ncbi:HTH-type transcriptional regulator [compost metagenome]
MAYEKMLKVLADPSRRALYEFLRRAPAHTAALAAELPLSQPAVSQHLKALLEAGLVTRRHEGRRTLYITIPGALDELRGYLDGLAGECGRTHPPPRASGAAQQHADVIELEARRWGEAWPGQDPNVYAVTMRLLLMGRYVDRALKETAERHGLQGSELLLLSVLRLAREGTLTPSQLQARLGVTKGAVTKLMNNLEHLGLVSRASSASDRRMSHVGLTQKAHDTLENILDHHEYGADHAAAKRLPAEQLARLAGLLQQYHGLMEDELAQRARQMNSARRSK